MERKTIIGIVGSLLTGAAIIAVKVAKPGGTPTPVEPIAETVPEFLKNLSGTKLTVTQLGDRVGKSAQEINKLLVEKGLQERWPGAARYSPIGLGKKLAEEVYKERAWGAGFVNLEWAEEVLNVLFSPEELKELTYKVASR